MDHVPKTMLCNQLERVRICFRNIGEELPIGNLKIASNGISSSRLCFSNSEKIVEKKALQLNKEASLSNSEFKYLSEMSSIEATNEELKSEPIKFNFSHKHNQSLNDLDSSSFSNHNNSSSTNNNSGLNKQQNQHDEFNVNKYIYSDFFLILILK